MHEDLLRQQNRRVMLVLVVVFVALFGVAMSLMALR
jgi:hypothetical protein